MFDKVGNLKGRFSHDAAHLAIYFSPVCGSIVAVVGQEIIVEFPEYMQGYSAIRG